MSRPRGATEGGRRRGATRAAAALVVATFLGATLGACGGAPPFAGPDEPRLPLQAYVSTLLGEAGAPRPVVRVEAPHRSLVFRRGETGFVADLRVLVTAWRDGRQVGGGVAAGQAVAASYAQTRGPESLLVEVPLVVRGDGPVRLDVEAVVPQSSRRWLRRLDLSPRAVATSPLAILSVALTPPAGPDGEHVVTAADTTVDLAVRLRPTGVGAWPPDGLRLVTTLTGTGGAPPTLRATPLDAAAVRGDTTLVERWAAARLPFGRHQLDVALESGGDGRRERLPFGPRFTVLVLRVPFADAHAWRQHVAWLDGLLEPAALDSLREAPATEREPAWRAAWARLGAAAGQAPEAAEAAHLRRIAEADERFGDFGRGALSDRGRAYVRYGEPERVDRSYDDLTRTGVWEIWHYPSRRLRLMFYDASAMNDFRLVEVRQD